MSYALLVLAAVDFAGLIWGFRAWLREKSNLALLLALTILFPIAFDAFTNGIGRFIGFGESLELLIRFRMTWYFFCMPFLIAIAVLLVGYAGVGWARSKAIFSAVLAAVICIAIYQIIAYWDMALYPSCVFDIERYVLEVPPSQACQPEDAGLGEFALSPFVPISAMSFLLATIVIVWKTRFAWYTVLLLASNIASAITVQIPRIGYMTFISYPFDGLLGLLIVLASIKLFERMQNE